MPEPETVDAAPAAGSSGAGNGSFMCGMVRARPGTTSADPARPSAAPETERARRTGWFPGAAMGSASAADRGPGAGNGRLRCGGVGTAAALGSSGPANLSSGAGKRRCGRAVARAAPEPGRAHYGRGSSGAGCGPNIWAERAPGPGLTMSRCAEVSSGAGSGSLKIGAPRSGTSEALSRPTEPRSRVCSRA
jgi:hypothetical protein